MAVVGFQLDERTPSVAGMPTFSLVIPAYNEAADIARTLASVAAQTLAPVEVIVVDDASTDGTASAVEGLGHAHVRVLRHETNRGAGAARNTGVQAARGDVVVFLDADDVLRPNFLHDLAAAYRAGADAVAVESRVADQRAATGRFLEAEHSATYGQGAAAAGWTAAFSCRRELAQHVRFPEELPGCGGEDGEFADRLTRSGRRLLRVSELVVDRHVPTDLRGFVKQGMARGRPVPYIDRRLRGHGLAATTARRAAATLVTLARMLLVVPNARLVARYARHSPLRLRDLPSFWALYHLRVGAVRAGEWSSVRRLWLARLRGER